MNTTKYSAEDLTRQTGVPVCLITYYAQIGLLGEQVMPLESTLTKGLGLELVDFEEFFQCATEAGLSDEEIQSLLQLNERAEAKALHLAMAKMTELTQQQRSIARLQEHLETWIFEYCMKAESETSHP